MKNKMFKKLAAAGAAIMMAVTGMAMSASATDYTDSWMVRRIIINGYISSESKSSDTISFTPGTGRKITKVVTTCSSYSSGTTGNGSQLGVYCYIRRYNASGVLQENIGYYHHTYAVSSASFDVLAYGTSTVRAEYSIDNTYAINCHISGTAKGTIVNV